MTAFILVIFSGCQNADINKANRGQKIWFIKEHLVDCEGVMPQKCMLIKEDGTDKWEYFYDQIDGFEYEEGYRYKISVAISMVMDPPVDSSSLKYRLLELIDKKTVRALDL
jgi:hypothetical protein